MIALSFFSCIIVYTLLKSQLMALYFQVSQYKGGTHTQTDKCFGCLYDKVIRKFKCSQILILIGITKLIIFPHICLTSRYFHQLIASLCRQLPRTKILALFLRRLLLASFYKVTNSKFSFLYLQHMSRSRPFLITFSADALVQVSNISLFAMFLSPCFHSGVPTEA